jgi:membrane protease YdiL (CAAX protease family)
VLPVFVRGSGEVQSALPTDLTSGSSSRIDPVAELASTPDGPFLPPADALRADADLRENFAVGLELPSIRRFASVRGLAWAGLLPLLALVELDRELGSLEGTAAFVRAAVGLVVAVWIVRELLRPIPRHPRAIAALYIGAAARLLAISARHCGRGAGLVAVIAPLLALASGAALMSFAPSRRAVAAAILAELGLPETHPSLRVAPLALPLVVAAGLPLVLFGAMHVGLGLFAQAALFAVYATVTPYAIRFPRRAPFPLRAMLASAGAAFVLTLGLASAGHFSVQSASAIARCLNPERWASSLWRTLASTESLTLAHPRTTAERILLLVMTVLFVPWAEERIYRGVLQRALTARFGSRAGIALASVAFGLAHLGVYRSALWQAVLLGAGFGVAFEEGGMVCAVIVHAVWNVYLLV